MTRIDFYLLDREGDQAKQHFACRLTNKAYNQGRQVYVYTENEAQSRRLDDILWTFHPGAFVPHSLAGDIDHSPPAVVIGHQAPPPSQHDLLVSLRSDTPQGFSQFQRVAEVVSGHDNDKQQARDRFRFYRDRGYTLKTHNV